MKQSKQSITIIGSGLVVIGILLAAIGFFAGARFSIINTDNGLKAVGSGDRKQYEWSLKEFKKIEVNIADGDIEIIPSDEYKMEIETIEGSKITHSVENETLLIEEVSNSGLKFVMNLSFKIQETKIKIYVPKDAEFLDVTIASKFGDVQLDGLETNKLKVHSNDGEVAIHDIQSDELAIENRYGDVTGSNVKTNDLKIEIYDGDADLKSIETASTVMNNHYGNTSLRNFSSKETKIESADGDITVHGELLGQTIIDSNYGDISLSLTNKESGLSYNIQNDYGDIFVNGSQYVSKAINSVNTPHRLDINSADGDVEVSFK